MKRTILFLALAAAGITQARADEATMKPFILAWKDNGAVADDAAKVTEKLKAAGFEVVGSYAPYPDAMVITATNADMKAAAAKTEFGAYGAVERVSVTRVGGETQVSYSNPPYYAAAYRMGADMEPVAAKLKQALGEVAEFGPKDGLTASDLRSYRYMFGMEEFDDPITLAQYPTHDAAVAAVEKGLAAHAMGASKVYRIDIPGGKETVFGVALDNKGDSGQANDAYIMKEIDFKPLRSTAHLPYEMVVSGNKVYTLSARFRIAIDFPDLSMMGSNSFMNIMSSPDAIRTVLSHAAGADWSVLKGN